MALSSFVLAKVASLPLMLLYCFIGASTGALLSKKGHAEEMHKIEENKSLILAGIGLSCVTIAVITRYIKKELNTVSMGAVSDWLGDFTFGSSLLHFSLCTDFGTAKET